MAKVVHVSAGPDACLCGCGEPAVEGMADYAAMLAACKSGADTLKLKARSGGNRRVEAENLLWAWDRCEDALESLVHGRAPVFLGPPTPTWVAVWLERVNNL